MQDYVARELTHFVGRSLPDDASRYALLVQIFRSGTLLDPQYMTREAPPIVYFDMTSEDGAVHRLNYYPRPKFRVQPHGSVDMNELPRLSASATSRSTNFTSTLRSTRSLASHLRSIF